MTEEEKVENTIALKYITIKELKNIRTKVEKSEDEKIRLKIEILNRFMICIFQQVLTDLRMVSCIAYTILKTTYHLNFLKICKN